MKPEVFLEPLGVSELQSCARTHLKIPYAILTCLDGLATNSVIVLTTLTLQAVVTFLMLLVSIIFC